jgi:4'-phosphopantetheinyl transferase
VHVGWTELARWTALDDLRRLGWLDDVEAGRLAATPDPQRRAELAVSRHVLRRLVGEVAGVEPSEVRFGYSCTECGAPHGRPIVRRPDAAAALHVSLTHAGGLVAAAVTAAGAVGVDAEAVAAVGFSGFDDVALTATERAGVDVLSAADRSAERARLWVRKEASVKATGTGLSADHDPRTIDLDRLGAQLHDVAVRAEFAVAVAVLAVPTVALSVREVRPEPAVATAGPARAANAAAAR